MANTHDHLPTQPGLPSAPRHRVPDDPTCKPQCCPRCGSVECFERPRFFCGQLLTDRDLDAAQRYVIEKNKLHNRYLVGAGVVCGLVVHCDPCDDCTIRIDPGYAIDCCGNDIVVCEPAVFNVCEYIEKCLRDKDPMCEDRIRPRSRCDDLPKTYCLIVSYQEEPARPVTALKQDGGCGCGGSSPANRCEPTRIRETYRFDLVAQADPKVARPIDNWSKANATLQELYTVPASGKATLKYATQYKSAIGNPDAQLLAYRSLRDYVWTYVRGSGGRCRVEEDLARIDSDYLAKGNTYYASAFLAGYQLLLNGVKQRLCQHWLVPCPPCDDHGVRLACLTFQNGKVLDICNTVRTQVLTGRSLRYWFEPLFAKGAALLEKFCCGAQTVTAPDAGYAKYPLPGTPQFASMAAPMASVAAMEATHVPQPLTNDQAHRVFARLEKVMTLVKDQADSALLRLQAGDLIGFLDSTGMAELAGPSLPDLSPLLKTESIMPLDLYQASLPEVEKVLESRKLRVAKKTLAAGPALAPPSAAAMMQPLPPGISLELVHDEQQMVIGIRLVTQERTP